MQTVTILIEVQGEPAEALPIVKRLGDGLKALVPTTHTTVVKFFIRCARCGERMRLAGRNLICDPCAREEAMEAMEERSWFLGLQPITTAEEPAELAF